MWLTKECCRLQGTFKAVRFCRFNEPHVSVPGSIGLWWKSFKAASLKAVFVADSMYATVRPQEHVHVYTASCNCSDIVKALKESLVEWSRLVRSVGSQTLWACEVKERDSIAG